MKPFGRESNAHKLLKQKSVLDLKQQGYEVHAEYRLYIIKKLWIVDVVGFKGNESIAVECGHTPHNKIEALKSVFTKVLHITYSNAIYPKKMRMEIASRITPTTNKAISKIFGHGRVMMPVAVSRSLNVKDGEKIVWIIQDGKWVVEKA